MKLEKRLNKLIVLEVVGCLYLFVLVLSFNNGKLTENQVNKLSENEAQVTEDSITNDKNLVDYRKPAVAIEETSEDVDNTNITPTEVDVVSATGSGEDTLADDPVEDTEDILCFDYDLSAYTSEDVVFGKKDDVVTYMSEEYPDLSVVNIQRTILINNDEEEFEAWIVTYNNEDETTLKMYLSVYGDTLDAAKCTLDK